MLVPLEVARRGGVRSLRGHYIVVAGCRSDRHFQRPVASYGKLSHSNVPGSRQNAHCWPLLYGDGRRIYEGVGALLALAVLDVACIRPNRTTSAVWDRRASGSCVGCGGGPGRRRQSDRRTRRPGRKNKARAGDGAAASLQLSSAELDRATTAFVTQGALLTGKSFAKLSSATGI